MKLSDQLTDYVNAAFTGLYVQTHEPDEAENEIVQHAQRKKWKMAVWDIASGLRLPGNGNGSARRSWWPAILWLSAFPAGTGKCRWNRDAAPP